MDLLDLKSSITRVQGLSQAKAKVETLSLRTVRLLKVEVSHLNLLYYSRIKSIDHDIEPVYCEGQNCDKD